MAGAGGRRGGGGQGYLVQEPGLAHQMWGLGKGRGHQGRELEQVLAQLPDQGREPVHLWTGRVLVPGQHYLERVLVLGQHYLERVLAQGQWNW